MNKQTALNTSENVKAERHALIQSLGIEYKATFVPWSKSRNKGEKHKSLNWTVTLSKGGRSLVTDYMQGIGHLTGYKMTSPYRITLDEEDALNRSVENGLIYALRTIVTEKQRAPSLEEVFYSLVMDSSVLDSASFEEWAGDFGYDTDSREAEKIYRACLDIALSMRAMVGDFNLSKLRDLFADF